MKKHDATKTTTTPEPNPHGPHGDASKRSRLVIEVPLEDVAGGRPPICQWTRPCNYCQSRCL